MSACRLCGEYQCTRMGLGPRGSHSGRSWASVAQSTWYEGKEMVERAWVQVLGTCLECPRVVDPGVFGLPRVFTSGVVEERVVKKGAVDEKSGREE